MFSITCHDIVNFIFNSICQPCYNVNSFFPKEPPTPRTMLSSVFAAAAAAKSLQSCPTLLDLTDGSPPGSPVPGILQARTLEWVAISFSNAGK